MTATVTHLHPEYTHTHTHMYSHTHTHLLSPPWDIVIQRLVKAKTTKAYQKYLAAGLNNWVLSL